MPYAIKFTFDDNSVVYSGLTPDGVLGFAPTLDSAERYSSEEVAQRFLKNGYATTLEEYGEVIEVGDE